MSEGSSHHGQLWLLLSFYFLLFQGTPLQSRSINYRAIEERRGKRRSDNDLLTIYIKINKN